MEIVSVSMSVERACQDLPGALASIRDSVGPGRPDRIVFLPPLISNLWGLERTDVHTSLDLGVRSSIKGRWRRRLGVWFAYPKAGAQRRRWLVNHDRVHGTLRGPIAGLARELGCVVVGGTALLDHPRTHWEEWPHTGALFHTAWSFGADGEPFDVLRDGEPSWDILKSARLDTSRAGAGEHLRTPLGDIAMDWGRGAGEGGTMVWRPLATDSPGPTAPVRGRALVQSCLVGTLGVDLKDDSVILIPGFTQRESRPRGCAAEDGVSWCAAEVGPQL